MPSRAFNGTALLSWSVLYEWILTVGARVRELWPLWRKAAGRTMTAISGLLFRCRPAAIIRSIIAFIIDSIKTVSPGWPCSHVSQESFKAHPPLTNQNAPPSIVQIGRMSWIQTPLLHGYPGMVGVCVPPTVNCRRRFLPQTLFVKTTAAFSFLTAHIFQSNRYMTAAITLTLIQLSAPFVAMAKSYDRQPSVPGTNTFWHTTKMSYVFSAVKE